MSAIDKTDLVVAIVITAIVSGGTATILDRLERDRYCKLIGQGQFCLHEASDTLYTIDLGHPIINQENP